MSLPFAPLLAGDPLVEERLQPFRLQGVLASIDVHVVDHLGMLVGESNPDVLLALALAVLAPRYGHVCVDLAKVKELAWQKDTASEEACVEPLPWPDIDPWIRKVASSPLVRLLEEHRNAPFVLDGSSLYSDRYYTYQSRLAEALRLKTCESHELPDSEGFRKGLEVLFPPLENHAFDRQKLGAAMALLGGLTVLSGGPGTGKTHTVRNVLALLWAQWAVDHEPASDGPGPQVALAAPTGKAAARMHEALCVGLDAFVQKAASILPKGKTPDQLLAFLQSLQPCTIHRLLRYNPTKPTRFRHDAKTPLPHDMVLIDESSMVDLALMTKLVDAVAPQTRLILLGDRNQLASVEAGTVLAGICGPVTVQRMSMSESRQNELLTQAGIDVREQQSIEKKPKKGLHDAIVLFDTYWRFSTSVGIFSFAKACTDDTSNPSQLADIIAQSNFSDAVMVPSSEKEPVPDSIQKLIVDGYRPYLERLLAGAKKGESLSAFHRSVLEAFGSFRILCAHRRGRWGVTGMNREVIRLFENLEKPLRGFDATPAYWIGRPILILRNDEVIGRFNGDVGIVVKDPKGKVAVAFAEAGGVTYVSPARLPEHQTVFAMTIHKSQGSEFDHTLVMLPHRDTPILTKELVYTAVTRARQRMTMVGQRKVLVEALARTVQRASGLEKALWEDG